MGDHHSSSAFAGETRVENFVSSSSSDSAQLGDEVPWPEAEARVAQLIAEVQPTRHADIQRGAVANYVERLIRRCFDCQVYPFGSVPLKTYLPDGDIDLTAFSLIPHVKDTWANEVRAILEQEEHSVDAEYQVKEVQVINAEVKLIKCVVENIIVDISFNQVGGLCTLCFLGQVDKLIGRRHLFKRSIILVKAWCYYESRLLGAHHGLISTYGLETLVLYIFHVFHGSLNGPLQVLLKFLEFFSTFDWDNYCLSLQGPIPISSLSSLPDSKPAKPVGGEDGLLLQESFLRKCSEAFSVFPGGNVQEGQKKPFVQKFMNVIDPLLETNNLGRSVSKGNFHRIRAAFAYGARKLRSILHGPREKMLVELDKFFQNTWTRHGKVARLDVLKESPPEIVPLEIPAEAVQVVPETFKAKYIVPAARANAAGVQAEAGYKANRGKKDGEQKHEWESRSQGAKEGDSDRQAAARAAGPVRRKVDYSDVLLHLGAKLASNVPSTKGGVQTGNCRSQADIERPAGLGAKSSTQRPVDSSTANVHSSTRVGQAGSKIAGTGKVQAAVGGRPSLGPAGPTHLQKEVAEMSDLHSSASNADAVDEQAGAGTSAYFARNEASGKVNGRLDPAGTLPGAPNEDTLGAAQSVAIRLRSNGKVDASSASGQGEKVAEEGPDKSTGDGADCLQDVTHEHHPELSSYSGPDLRGVPGLEPLQLQADDATLPFFVRTFQPAYVYSPRPGQPEVSTPLLFPSGQDPSSLVAFVDSPSAPPVFYRQGLVSSLVPAADASGASPVAGLLSSLSSSLALNPSEIRNGPYAVLHNNPRMHPTVQLLPQGEHLAPAVVARGGQEADGFDVGTPAEQQVAGGPDQASLHIARVVARPPEMPQSSSGGQSHGHADSSRVQAKAPLYIGQVPVSYQGNPEPSGQHLGPPIVYADASRDLGRLLPQRDATSCRPAGPPVLEDVDVAAAGPAVASNKPLDGAQADAEPRRGRHKKGSTGLGESQRSYVGHFEQEAAGERREGDDQAAGSRVDAELDSLAGQKDLAKGAPEGLLSLGPQLVPFVPPGFAPLAGMSPSLLSSALAAAPLAHMPGQPMLMPVRGQQGPPGTPHVLMPTVGTLPVMPAYYNAAGPVLSSATINSASSSSLDSSLSTSWHVQPQYVRAGGFHAAGIPLDLLTHGGQAPPGGLSAHLLDGSQAAQAVTAGRVNVSRMASRGTAGGLWEGQITSENHELLPMPSTVPVVAWQSTGTAGEVYNGVTGSMVAQGQGQPGGLFAALQGTAEPHEDAADEDGADILAGDTAAHLVSLTYGRMCQEASSRSHTPVPHPSPQLSPAPSLAVPGHRQWDATGRPARNGNSPLGPSPLGFGALHGNAQQFPHAMMPGLVMPPPAMPLAAGLGQVEDNRGGSERSQGITRVASLPNDMHQHANIQQMEDLAWSLRGAPNMYNASGMVPPSSGANGQYLGSLGTFKGFVGNQRQGTGVPVYSHDRQQHIQRPVPRAGSMPQHSRDFSQEPMSRGPRAGTGRNGHARFDRPPEKAQQANGGSSRGPDPAPRRNDRGPEKVGAYERDRAQDRGALSRGYDARADRGIERRSAAEGGGRDHKGENWGGHYGGFRAGAQEGGDMHPPADRDLSRQEGQQQQPYQADAIVYAGHGHPVVMAQASAARGHPNPPTGHQAYHGASQQSEPELELPFLPRIDSPSSSPHVAVVAGGPAHAFKDHTLGGVAIPRSASNQRRYAGAGPEDPAQARGKERREDGADRDVRREPVIQEHQRAAHMEGPQELRGERGYLEDSRDNSPHRESRKPLQRSEDGAYVAYGREEELQSGLTLHVQSKHASEGGHTNESQPIAATSQGQQRPLQYELKEEDFPPLTHEK
eukprot:jgi/Mesen1/11019/ME000098S10414